MVTVSIWGSLVRVNETVISLSKTHAHKVYIEKLFIRLDQTDHVCVYVFVCRERTLQSKRESWTVGDGREEREREKDSLKKAEKRKEPLLL